MNRAAGLLIDSLTFLLTLPAAASYPKWGGGHLGRQQSNLPPIHQQLASIRDRRAYEVGEGRAGIE